jgi:hypothetical protein
VKRTWHWLAAWLEELLFAQARSDSDAIKVTDKADSIKAPDGTLIRFVGRALEWDLAKSTTIGLEFEAPWFTHREIELFAWSTIDATIELDSRDLSQPQLTVELAPSSFRSLRLEVLADQPAKGGITRVSFNAVNLARADGKIYFGLGGHESERATRIRSHLAPSPALFLYLSTWFNLACLLFIFMAGFGLKASGALATLLVLVPNVLEKLGAQWASKFSPGAIAQWMRKRVPRVIPYWRASTIPLAGVVMYMVTAFIYFAVYEWSLDDQLARSTTSIGERSEFFCRYPERVEARVLLAKHLDIRSAEKSLHTAYDSALSTTGKTRFLTECLSRTRLLAWLVDDAPRHQTNARILHASLLWNTSSKEEFHDRVRAINDVLSLPRTTIDDRVAQLTFAKYQLKAVKNYNEQVHCKDMASQACLTGRKACIAARSTLLQLLDQPWAHERASVAFLEAHDAAASSHLSIGCSYGSSVDTEAAIKHYHAIIGALPRGPTLEQPLTQMNFRKLVDSLSEKYAEHPTSRQWREECAKFFPDSCKLIAETFIKDERQTFFEQNREDRARSWGRASITYLEGDELRKRLWDEREKGWRWPL